jgi:MFS family permease
MPLLANHLISSYGWQRSYIFLGLIILAIIVISAQFLRHAPNETGVSPDKHKASETNRSNLHDRRFPLREVVRSKLFVIIFIIFFCAVFCSQTVIVHLVPYATDIGISPTVAATLISAVGWTSILTKIGMGRAGDRFGNRRAMIIVFVMMLAAIVWLQFQTGDSLWMLYLFAIVFAVGYGGESAVRSPMVTEFFGMRGHGEIFGLTTFAAGLGGAFGPLIAGRIYDVTSSYHLAFMLCAIISAVGLMVAMILKPARE